MVYDKIVEIVAEQFAVGADTLSRETSFVDTLGADSLDIVELTMSIEETFKVPEVADEDLQKIATIGDLCDYVDRALGNE